MFRGERNVQKEEKTSTYLWNRDKRYNDYPGYFKELFSERVQKLSIHAGFTCPNRDGSKGTGGCTYCNNQTFNPAYCQTGINISEQIETGISFFAPKYKTQKYLAYFQAYTNTYDKLEVLTAKYEEALRNPNIIGIVVGTRPDCVNDEILDYFKKLQERVYVTIEYGIESTNDDTLKLINRGHTYQESIDAIVQTAERGIPVGGHMILGLPREDRTQTIQHAHELSKLPLETLKLHQLQLIKGTRMAKQYEMFPEWFHLYSAEEYIDLVIDFLEVLNPNIVMERFISQSPKELLLAPTWGLKNFEFVGKLEKRLKERNTYQGRLYRL